MTLEHFQAKWMPVRGKKMRQAKNLERRSDSFGSEYAMDAPIAMNSLPFDAGLWHRFPVGIVVRKPVRCASAVRRSCP